MIRRCEICGNELTAKERLCKDCEKKKIEKDIEAGIFPLQTQQSLADRWGISRQNVAWKAKHNKKFPKPLEGVIADTKGGPKVYALCDIEQYEKEMGIKNEFK